MVYFREPAGAGTGRTWDGWGSVGRETASGSSGRCGWASSGAGRRLLWPHRQSGRPNRSPRRTWPGAGQPECGRGRLAPRACHLWRRGRCSSRGFRVRWCCSRLAGS